MTTNDNAVFHRMKEWCSITKSESQMEAINLDTFAQAVDGVIGHFWVLVAG